MDSKVSTVEQDIRLACERGDYDTAATVVIREYGPEIFGVLVARLRNRDDAAEVFSQFSHDLWLGLRTFAWKCSARVWAYKVARNASLRYVTAACRRPGRHVPLSDHPALEKVVQGVRTTTRAYLRTENKTRMRDLRERLSNEDQELLILRVDKGMSFRDMVFVVSDPAPGDERCLAQEAARLRKRFQLAKERLRRLAMEDGLL